MLLNFGVSDMMSGKFLEPDGEPSFGVHPTASVSVVIPCFRCSATIVRTVESIASQTLMPIEVILVDDSSQDGTLDVLLELQACYGANWLKICELASNAGPGTARNAGWKIARGEYVAFVDSDDSWHSQKIELQYRWMAQNPNAILSSHLIVMGDECKERVFEAQIRPARISRRQLLISNRFPTSTVMVRRDVAFRFADGQRYCEDYRLWLYICFFVGECYRFEQALTYNYKAVYGASGLSGRLWDMEKGELASYWNLYRSRGINALELVFWGAFSFVKFLRRISFARVHGAFNRYLCRAE